MHVYLCLPVTFNYVSVHLSAKKSADLSTLFDVGGVVGKSVEYCGYFG